MRKSLLLAAVLSLPLTVFQGCYGPFKLTRKVYEWNDSIESRWGREAMFLVLNILPVYGFSAFADAVLFNAIDFWGGENPIALNEDRRTRMVTRGGRQAVLSIFPAQRKIRVDLFDRYRPAKHFVVVSEDGRTVARGPDGKMLMSALTLKDGNIAVKDTRGKNVPVQVNGSNREGAAE